MVDTPSQGSESLGDRLLKWLGEKTSEGVSVEFAHKAKSYTIAMFHLKSFKITKVYYGKTITEAVQCALDEDEKMKKGI